MKYVIFSILTCLGLAGVGVAISHAHNEPRPISENVEQTIKNLEHPVQTAKYIFNP